MSYSSKAAAKKGAVRQGLNADTLEFCVDKDGRWSWVEHAPAPVIEEPVVEEKVPVPAPEKEPVEKIPGLKIEKDREEKNGILKPSVGGKCRAIWDACDKFREETKRIPMPKEMRVMAEQNGWNANNAVIEMYQWRKFQGLIGRR